MHLRSGVIFFELMSGILALPLIQLNLWISEWFAAYLLQRRRSPYTWLGMTHCRPLTLASAAAAARLLVSSRSPVEYLLFLSSIYLLSLHAFLFLVSCVLSVLCKQAKEVSTVKCRRGCVCFCIFVFDCDFSSALKCYCESPCTWTLRTQLCSHTPTHTWTHNHETVARKLLLLLFFFFFTAFTWFLSTS